MSGDVRGNYSDEQMDEKECYRPDDYSGDIVELVFSASNLPIHLFVIIAMISHWNVVKRNVVNLYAGNVVLSSLVANIWTLYVSASITAKRKTGVKYQDFENQTDDHWETSKVAFGFDMVIVTAGSIGLLINAMRSIQFRVRRTVGGVANQATNPACETKEKCSRWGRIRASNKHHPKCWALFYISLVWLVPILITVLSARLNTCVFKCHCQYYHDPVGDEQNCKDFGDSCSSLLPPLSRLSLGAGVGLWLLYVVILTASLAKTFHDLKNLTKKRCDSVRAQAEAEEKSNELTGLDKDAEANNGSQDDMARIMHNADDHSDDEQRDGTGTKQSKTKRSIAIKLNKGKECRKMSGSIFIQSLRKNFRLLLLMFLAYIFGSIPMILVAILDVSSVIEESALTVEMHRRVIILGILPLIAHAVCTIIICIYLPGLKSAVRALMVKITRCCS